MNHHYLRVEAVNLGGFIYDTQNLPTVRGGSLALLRSIDWVKDAFDQLEPVSVGASSGLFKLEGASLDEARQMRDAVADFLRTHRHGFEGPNDQQLHLDLGMATFVVAVIEASEDEDDFALVDQKLLAANRWRQMTSLDLAMPATVSEKETVCAIDHVRPTAPDRRGGDGQKISESVFQRRQYGRSQKQAFYEEETEESFPKGFSQSFQTLAYDPIRGNLNGKIGVLYLDGNHFGRVMREVCTTPSALRAFDEELRGRRQGILREILVEARDSDPGFLEVGLEGADAKDFTDGELPKSGALRFETLVWGGDDILWVMPAWRALAVTAAFFRRAAGWTAPVAPPGKEPSRLTHAAGLVLCHDKAPIYRIRRLVEDLADQAKRVSRKCNLLAYQVLESFDHVGDSVQDFRQARTPPGLGPQQLLLTPSDLQEALQLSSWVLDALPHGKVLDAARELMIRGVDSISDPRGPARRLRAGLAREAEEGLERLLSSLGGEPAAWLHLAELWDFLAGGGADGPS